MDDLIIPAESEEEAIHKLKMVLSLSEKHGLQIKWSKCEFLKSNIEYLGYEIEAGKVKPSSKKIKAIELFKEPKDEKNLQSFLGLTSYFRKFVENYAILAKPLSDMLRKNIRFQFSQKERQSFEKLKKILCSEPVLKIYSIVAETELHCDASKIGLGSILLQKCSEDQKMHPVYYYSKKTTKHEELYSSYELEVLSIIAALKKFRVYLLGLQFTIITDCIAFKGTMERKELSSRIAGWALCLQEFNYKLEHRASSRMRHVDGLSRNPVVLLLDENINKRLQAAQRDDDNLKPIFTLLKQGAYDNYICNNGILFRCSEGNMLLVVPKQMQKEIVKLCHDQGHFGVQKTKELISREYYIPKLENKIKSCIKNCVPCLLTERKRGKQDGLLNPIPKGDVPLSTLHVDHLGHLTSTRKLYKYVLCIIDGFSKFVWIFPTKTLSTSEVIQKMNVLKAIFGNPDTLITDKGTCFTSADFQNYCCNENIRHYTITTGVARGNGQIERIHEIIIPALTKLAINKPVDWYKNTDKLQRYLNNSYQRGIAMTPFELLFGVKMKCPEEKKIAEIIEAEAAALFNIDRNELRENAKMSILKLQDENRREFNKKRKIAPKYKLGDIVVIKKTQFSNSSKLQPTYLGPYVITKISENDRYDVKKLGEVEGPRNTSTCAEYIKPYYYLDSDDSEFTEEEDCTTGENNFEASESDGMQG